MAEQPPTSYRHHTTRERKRGEGGMPFVVADGSEPLATPYTLAGRNESRDCASVTALAFALIIIFLYFCPCEGQGGPKIHYGQSVRPDARGVSDSHGLKTP
ncbi:hypothetical protein EVAR_42584_1 [Eumeta japonica]|uniref:Uncharacterized protein n=1 Tax=Eumeta variegata TaxID=151549 RepID=A0A4C1ZWI2_EUMVA|nr:hypothetical protein EVAR_42584_1 [Eumeta japonica]